MDMSSTSVYNPKVMHPHCVYSMQHTQSKHNFCFTNKTSYMFQLMIIAIIRLTTKIQKGNVYTAAMVVRCLHLTNVALYNIHNMWQNTHPLPLKLQHMGSKLPNTMRMRHALSPQGDLMWGESSYPIIVYIKIVLETTIGRN